MASKYHPKKLIVEGKEDLRVIPELVENNGIVWKVSKEQRIVEIKDFGGDKFTKESVIAQELKASGLTTLGLMLDADDNLFGKWQSIRNLVFPPFPIFLKNYQKLD